MVVDGLEVAAQLEQLGVGHQERVGGREAGAGQHGGGAGRTQQELFGLRMRLGIGDQVLAHLRVEVVGAVLEGDGVVADRHAVDPFIGVVRVHEHAHRDGRVVDPLEVALHEGAVVPEAGPHRLDRLVDAVRGGLIRVLRLGAVETGPVEGRQVLVVGAGPIAQRLPLRVGGVHGGQGLDDERGRRRVLDGVPQVVQHLLLDRGV